MIKTVDKHQIEKKTVFYMENGYHCAEAVAAAVLEGMGQDAAAAVAHATAFGGGVGRSFDDACGALSGALIVIGQLYPRQGRGEPWDKAADLGAGIRHRFIHEFGTTHCGSLRNRFGRTQPEKCTILSGQLAAVLAELLQTHRAAAADHP